MARLDLALLFMRIIFVAALLLCCFSVTSHAEEKDKPKTPIPDAATQKQIEKDVGEVFKEEFRKTRMEDKAALAATLLKQGIESREDGPRYMLFKMALDLATQASDVETALSASQRIISGFAIENEIAFQEETLRKLAGTATTPAANALIVNAVVLLIARACDEDRYDVAVKLAVVADNASRKSQDPTLTKKVQSTNQSVRDMQNEFNRLQTAQQTIIKNPSDPTANATLGRFYSISKGDWPKALLFFEKAAEPALLKAAQLERSQGTAPIDKIALADEWWQLAEKETGRGKKAFQKHAATYYRQAFPEATGLAKTKIEKRLATIEEHIFLGDLKPLSVKVGFGELEAGKAKPNIVARGAVCQQYLIAHAASSVVYEIPAGVDTFSATGIRPGGYPDMGSWKYRVTIDGKRVLETNELKKVPDFEIPIWVAIPPGSKEIKLETDALGDYAGDHSIWAYPRFHR